MQKIIVLIIVLLFTINGFGQIVNGNFENWRTLPTSPVSQDPVGWTSNNLGILHHYGALSVEKSSDSYIGNNAVRINQFFDSSNNCQTNYLVYKEFVIDTSTYSKNCLGFTPNISTDYDTLSQVPLKISFYYKTSNIKNSVSNYIEFNIIDTAHPFGLPSGHGFQTVALTPTSTYTKKELVFNTILSGGKFQLLHIKINVKNSYDTLFQNGYFLIDNIQFEGGYLETNENIINDDITIYPNPSTNNLYFNSKKSIINKVSIIDISGKEALNVSLSSKTYSIDITSLKKGVYFVKVFTSDGIVVKKVVKE